MSISRRTFLRSGLAAALSGMSPVLLRMAIPTASAADDYRAAVCIFLHGGNDGSNCLVALDSARFQEYSAARGPLALSINSLLPVQARRSGERFGFHPQLSGLSDMFNSGRLAVLANVGTLHAPLTREQYLENSIPVPQKLFSHSDQTSQWQSSRASEQLRPTTGWGGLIADALTFINGAALYPSMTTMAGPNLYCEGEVVRPSAVHPTNIEALLSSGSSYVNRVRHQSVYGLADVQSGHSLIDSAAKANSRMFAEQELLRSVLASYPHVETPFPSTSLGQQLRKVAQLIRARHSLGLGRQLFFVGVGGFDTHSNQLLDQANMLAHLNGAMTAFYRATEELGVAPHVLSFTLSEFGRTVSPANGGSDHGWGSHHFVMGGAVRGGDIYGIFPSLAIGGADDAGDKGRLIPTTSVDQYAATVAGWMGVASGDIAAMFPNLTNFTQQRLPFV